MIEGQFFFGKTIYATNAFTAEAAIKLSVYAVITSPSALVTPSIKFI